MSNFQVLDTAVDWANYHADVLGILSTIRPQWQTREITITVRHLSTFVFSCY